MSKGETIKWPLAMPSAKMSKKPALNISKLSEEDRRFVWREIKQHRPALAELLMMMAPQEINDRLIASAKELFPDEVARLNQEQLQHQFGADLIVDLEQLPASVHHLRK